jgi:hypothetical protein
LKVLRDITYKYVPSANAVLADPGCSRLRCSSSVDHQEDPGTSGSRALYIFSSTETEKGEKVLSVGKTFVQIRRIPKRTFEISKEDNARL